jgi:hypothetical protein
MSLCAGFRTAVAARDHGPRLTKLWSNRAQATISCFGLRRSFRDGGVCRSLAHRSDSQCQKIAFGLATAANPPPFVPRAFGFLWDLQAKKRADERTRTADLLITSDQSGVAGTCRGLQIPHF